MLDKKPKNYFWVIGVFWEASEEFDFSNLILGLIGFYMEKFIYVIASPFFLVIDYW